MNGHDDEGNKDDGGVWTSYSDLFTTVAVIFLVMFVFALIKAGVSKMETVVAKKRHEQELKGQLSEKTKKETDQKLKKVESSISEITDYEQIIDQKMIQMNSFVKDLKKNKKVLKELIKEHQKKDTLLQTASASIKKYETEIKEGKAKNQELQKGLESKNKELVALTKTKDALQANLGDLKKAYQHQKQKILAQNQQKKQLENELLGKQKELEKTISDSIEKNVKISKLENQKEIVKRTLAQTSKSFAEFKQEKEAEVAQQLKEIATKKKEVAKLQDQIKSANVTIEEERIRIKNLRQEFANKSNALKSANEKIAEQANQKQVLEKKLQSAVKLNQELDKTLKEKLREKAELAKQKTELERKLKKVGERALSAENKSKELEIKLASTTNELNKTISERNTLSHENKRLKKVETNHLALQKSHEVLKNKKGELEKELSSNRTALSKSKADLERLQNENHHLNFELAKSSSTIEGQGAKIGKLSNENDLLSQDNDKLRRDIASIGDSRAQILNENLGLRGEIEKLKKNAPVSKAELAKINEEKVALKKRLDIAQKDLGFEKKKLEKMEVKFIEKLDQMDKEKKNLHACVENKSKLIISNKNLKESLNNFANKVANVKGKLRSTIAKELADEFAKANLNVKVDKKTGNVVLLMDKNFRFKKNSFYLNKTARATLKKIIPIYSKALFGNEKVKDKIGSFNVIGHASPSFRGKFVEPNKENSKAYSYNMRLSAQRASSIANYIFSKSIGAYPFKNELQTFTKSIGQGYIKPVMTQPKVGRGLASVKQGTCGPYDCYASQRVELSFTLKDDVASINKLIDMAKGIN